MGFDGKTTFQYASAGRAAGENILAALGTTSNALSRIAYITDLKVTTGAASSNVEILGQGTDGARNGQALSFYVGTSTAIDFRWEVPFRLVAYSSAFSGRAIVASADGVGVKYAVSGYLDK